MEKIVKIVQEVFTPPAEKTWEEERTPEQRHQLITGLAARAFSMPDPEDL